jgi:hypothetical protein
MVNRPSGSDLTWSAERGSTPSRRDGRTTKAPYLSRRGVVTALSPSAFFCQGGLAAAQSGQDEPPFFRQGDGQFTFLEPVAPVPDVRRSSDAVLLEFDPVEWERPYQTSQHRPILKRMLELHAIFGDRSETFELGLVDDSPNVFLKLLEVEKAKLAAESPAAIGAREMKPARQRKRPAELRGRARKARGARRNLQSESEMTKT